jgi:hypothetical protein
MLRIICAVNNSTIDEVRVVNTGHQENGKHLYRIQEPAKYNYLEVYHDRKDPWHVLAERVLATLNRAGYNQRKEYQDKIALEYYHMMERERLESEGNSR